jgi:hypothetical protein
LFDEISTLLFIFRKIRDVVVITSLYNEAENDK